jgi:hypothetical protein
MVPYLHIRKVDSMSTLGPKAKRQFRYSFTIASVGRMHPWAGCGQWLNRMTVTALPAIVLAHTTREDVYNVLWGLVFAFATLNILSLGAKRFEPDRGGLSFGEVLAVLVVLISLIMLAWELLYLFNILPIRLTPR